MKMIQINKRFTQVLVRTVALLLMMVGGNEAWAVARITGFPYWTDFGSSREPFEGGDLNSANSNIGSVFVVYNTTATATFARTYSLKATETVTLSFSAYHGYQNNSNKISSFSIKNSDGVSLVEYHFNHQTGNITDVIIGGNKVNGYEVNGQSCRSNTEFAYGIVGNGRPYIGGEQGVNTPKVTISIYGNGYVIFNIYRSAGASSIDETFWGTIGDAKVDLESFVITNNCDYEDRSIAIDDFYLQSSLFYQDYEADGVSPDWSTNDGSRYTPVILEEGSNHYMSVAQSERNNNGTVLRSASLQNLVSAGTDFNLSFDLKVSSSTYQSPTSFTIYDASNSAAVFSLTATSAWATTWKVNSTDTEVTLPGSNSGSEDISNVTWISIKIESRSGVISVAIKNKYDNKDILEKTNISSSSIGGLGRMEFVTSRYNANFAIDNIWLESHESLAITWSGESATVNIVDVGNSNPNAVDGLPTLYAHTYNISSYGSSNNKVAVCWGDRVQIVGIGTTLIYATDENGNRAGYLLTIVGDRVEPEVYGETIEFNDAGVIASSQDAEGEKSHVLSTGLTVTYGYTGESSIVVNSGIGNVLKILDANGFSHPNISSPYSASYPAQDAYGGGYIKLVATELGYLIVKGNVSSDRTVVYRENGEALIPVVDTDKHSLRVELSAGTYYLYNQNLGSDQSSSIYVPLVHSISFVHAYFEEAYQVIKIPDGGTYPLQNVLGLSSPTYSIIGYAGDLDSDSNRPIISGDNITNITASGALKIKAESGTNSATYVLTVAYPATPYPGKLWDFNTDQPCLMITDNSHDVNSYIGFPLIDANKQWAYVIVEGNDQATSATMLNLTDNHGDNWIAELKNVNNGAGRDARWRYINSVKGDNAFIIGETAGLIFNTGNKGFFIRNDRQQDIEHTLAPSCWSHVGIRRYGASFTIPQLTKGDVIEINWKRESSGAGGSFIADNATDLRGKSVDEVFEMTGSQNDSNGDLSTNVGYTSFIAKDNGDVTFTIQDNGATDILSIRIYSGSYQPTMLPINSRDNSAAPTTMLVDNEEKSNTYNYCNVLYSTNTGPAMYVVKGYEAGKGFNIGVDAAKVTNDKNDGIFNWHSDPDGYPVEEAELERLIDLRKNLVELKVKNNPWKSDRNAYNNGYIAATSGWGKVTIRMNNYTNDMKYVIGYTPDYTLTIGSAPHQKYPYTWDFTHISAQQVTKFTDNAYNTIKNQDTYNTNWEWSGNGRGVASLKIANEGQFDSQYVPGAVLVTTERALSKYGDFSLENYAKDELDGLGVNGKIAIHGDISLSGVRGTTNLTRTPVTFTEELMSFDINNYMYVKEYETVLDAEGNEQQVPKTWDVPIRTNLEAGSGFVQFGASDKIEYKTAGYGYKCDGDIEAEKNSTKYVLLTPLRPFEAGDVIELYVFSTTNPNGSNYGISMYAENVAGATAKQTVYIPSGLKDEILTLSYTVTSGDGIEGLSNIYVFRAHGSSTYIAGGRVSYTTTTSSDDINKVIYCERTTTLTIPDLNAEGKQDWIYVSSDRAPVKVVNGQNTITVEEETLYIDHLLYPVSSGADGPDANTTPELEDDAAQVYKYKVYAEGNAYLTFAAGTKIYKIGVTHILKEIHPVGGVGWATESRDHDIDHALTGYFTKNDVNAYTVEYNSYDMKNATVALTPVNEDGYVAKETGIVLRLDQTTNLSSANTGKYVPLFYPSYTLGASSTPTSFSTTGNMMYPNLEETPHGSETQGDNTKFILTNKYWTFNKDHALSEDESATVNEANAAGFYRMHIWKTTGDSDTKNTMASNTAYLLVPSDNLPAAVWTLQEGYSAARGNHILGVYNIVGPGSETAIDVVELTPGVMMDNNDIGGDETWYSVSGMKLSGPPTKAGIYIHHHRKVVIK